MLLVWLCNTPLSCSAIPLFNHSRHAGARFHGEGAAAAAAQQGAEGAGPEEEAADEGSPGDHQEAEEEVAVPSREALANEGAEWQARFAAGHRR